MKLMVNGEERALDEPQSVLAFVASFGLEPSMVVVERNGEILPRERYGATLLADGDVLEIVQMMAGG
jgi:thiamine biosynthesis protein ThiS